MDCVLFLPPNCQTERCATCFGPLPFLTPRPPELMVLNEPETGLHPDLLPALARLILAATAHTQIIVVSHAQKLIEIPTATPLYTRLHLLKDFGETTSEGTTLFSKPEWDGLLDSVSVSYSSLAGFIGYR